MPGDSSVWDRLYVKLKGLDKVHVKVGVLADQGGDESHDDAGGEITMVELMAIHEFGNDTIPERAPIRSTFNGAVWLPDFTAKLCKGVIDGKLTVENALALLGTRGASEVKKKITTGPHLPPPLQPATVAAKGSDRPLVDTGRLVASISFQVVTGEEAEA